MLVLIIGEEYLNTHGKKMAAVVSACVYIAEKIVMFKMKSL